MKLKSRIIQLVRNIGLQKEAINELHVIIEEKKQTKLIPEEVIPVISEDLKENKEKLKNLQRSYDQNMLSKMVKGGIDDDEMMAWWMNRY